VLVTATAGEDYGSATVRLTVGEPEADSQPETTTTTTSPPPAAAAATPPAGGDPGTPGGDGSGSGATVAPVATAPKRAPRKRRAPAPAADTPRPGELRGRVIETVPDPVTPVAAPVPEAAPDAGTGGGGGGILPPAAWTGVGVCLFLLAGWALERSGRRLRLPHRGVPA